ncbi:MAG: hypothetical protein GC164_07140 [Phycisphaera sp.]|nr:hypothetical protein [Phycisphaera sp.]
MRLVIDSLIALMLAAILGGVLLYHRQQQTNLLAQQQVYQALAHLQEQVLYRGALGENDTTESGFPRTVSPAWFVGEPPRNVLVPADQPWVDVAPRDDWQDQPPDPVIASPGQAGFWYNPNRGIFRARVVPQFSDSRTIELYNHLNGCALRHLPVTTDTQRSPTPYQKVEGYDRLNHTTVENAIEQPRQTARRTLLDATTTTPPHLSNVPTGE